jgi:predicted RNA methylase
VAQTLADGRPDVIFVPTPDEIVDEMLALAAVKPGELLYDLGCGGGRIVVTAAGKHGCRAVGFVVDPERVEEARRNVRIDGVENLVRIEQRNIFAVDPSPADVATLYLLPQLNVRLIDQLDRMKAGARIVSHDFGMVGIIPDRVVQLYLAQRNMYKTVYMWKAPLKRTLVPIRHEWTNSDGILAA